MESWDKINNQLQEQGKMLHDIHTELVGHKDLRRKGAIERIETLEKSQSKQAKKTMLLTGAGMAGSGLLGGIIGPGIAKTSFGKAIIWIFSTIFP